MIDIYGFHCRVVERDFIQLPGDPMSHFNFVVSFSDSSLLFELSDWYSNLGETSHSPFTPPKNGTLTSNSPPIETVTPTVQDVVLVDVTVFETSFVTSFENVYVKFGPPILF